MADAATEVFNGVASLRVEPIFIALAVDGERDGVIGGVVGKEED